LTPSAGDAKVASVNESQLSGSDVLGRLRELPGGPELLDVAARRGEVELIGGAVRDILLGREPRELDVVVAEDAAGFARELAHELGVLSGKDPDDSLQPSVHDRFRTALVSWGDGARIDVATRRTESYAAPGSLPDVREGTVEQDLQRRDFTVNAIAVALDGPRPGELRAAPGALDDLRAKRLRVLHDESFRDDPTRVLRLARYRARLRFEPDERTAELAAEAVREGALATISRARFGAELRLALAEPDPVAAFAALDELGALAALDSAIGLDPTLARNALAELPTDGHRDVLLLAALLLPLAAASRHGVEIGRAAGSGERVERTMRALLDALEFTAVAREAVLRTATAVPQLVDLLAQTRTPAHVHDVALTATVEAVALAAALADAQERPEAVAAARRWLSDLRHVRLAIDGNDLLASGIVAGPDLGQRLERVLRRKLDGELADGREAELTAALEEL
jgi:tRNA nucleotidyltransferase (CCA-adding enzyme)